MTINILDFGIVAVPLAILLAALLSCGRNRLRRQAAEVSEAKESTQEAAI